MICDRIIRMANKFLSLAMGDLDLLAEKVKELGSYPYNGYTLKFTDSDFVNDRDGQYIFLSKRLKDGIVIIQYDMIKKILILMQGVKGVVNKVDNASISDLNNLITHINELSDLDEISTSYDRPEDELRLDELTRAFRSSDTNLLDFVEKSLGIKVPHGKLLGVGAEGEVYDYGNDKIIKLFLLPDKKKDAVLSFLKKLETIKSKHVSKIYHSGIAVRVGRNLMVGDNATFENPIWIAYYIADKVFPIKGEKDQEKVNTLKKALINEVGLDPWDYEDNPDNIMQDVDGNYIYVDFGSVADFLK